MATLEYSNHKFKVEIESNIDTEIDMASDAYIQFLKSLVKFNRFTQIDTLTLEKQNPTYHYDVETKDGRQTSYVFHRDNNDFEIELNTNGTKWVPEVLGKNIEARQRVFDLITEFEVFRIELEYF